jgi:hypothetical protein
MAKPGKGDRPLDQGGKDHASQGKGVGKETSAIVGGAEKGHEAGRRTIRLPGQLSRKK